jgi:hypothetical protein
MIPLSTAGDALKAPSVESFHFDLTRLAFATVKVVADAA